MKLFKNKKGSQIVETVMMWAFAVAAGSACIVYMGGVINESKNLNLSNNNAVLPTPIQNEESLIVGHRYRIDESIIDDVIAKKFEPFSISFKASNKEEMERFRRNSAISDINHDENGNFGFSLSYYVPSCPGCSPMDPRSSWQVAAEYGPSYMYLGECLNEFSFVYVSHSVYNGSITYVLPYIYEL